MNYPTVSLCADVDTLTTATAHFTLTSDPGIWKAGHLASVRLAGIVIQTHDDSGVSHLALTLERLARDLRTEARRVTKAAMQSYVRNEWASAHPEEAVPLDRGGDCQACGVPVDQLYFVPSDSRGDIDAECCASCAGVPVDLAEALSNAVKVGKPDEYGPDDARAEQHDDGLDTDRLVA